MGRRTKYPISLGHEFVAEVICTGKKVKNFSNGDLVVSDLNFRCGKCEYCKTHKSHLCIDNDIQKFTNRGFALYANIHYSYLLKINEIKNIPTACFIEPLSCVIHAANMINRKQYNNILINGGGSIGTLFCLYLSRVHKLNVFVKEPNKAKLDKLVFCYGVKPYIPNVRYDIIIECSNSPEGMQEALDMANRGDELCVMSHLYGIDTSFIYETICKKELNVTFPLRNGEKENLATAYHIIKNQWKPTDDCLFKIYNNIEDAFSDKASSEYNKQIINVSAL